MAAGQSGALHDTSVLYHAMEVDAQVFPHPPQGTNITNILHAQFVLQILMLFFIRADKYYVVDAGDPNRPGYLAPYKGERYHLP